MKTTQLSWLTLAAVLFFSLFWSIKATAQTVQYVTISVPSTGNNFAPPNTTNFAIQTNQLIALVGYPWNDGPSITANLPDGHSVIITPQAINQPPQIYTGFTNITLSVGNIGGVGIATFQITTPASVNIISNSYVPANAIVIPASATGNVQIILESSTDLVNWTAADPGVYGASSATNRFFRVRAVHN